MGKLILPLFNQYFFKLRFTVCVSLLVFSSIAIAEQADSNSSGAFAKIKESSSNAGIIDLGGEWQFKATDEKDWIQAKVPGMVWDDLLNSGRIEDPFYRNNELKVQWVEKKEWEYRKSFEVGEDFLKHHKLILDCRGLDTIAEIYLNNVLVAKTENMFIEYEFDVTRYLKKGLNGIHVVFRSILEWDRQQVESDTNVIWTSSKGRTFFTRKEASDFGWDWGIRLVSCGIWRPIRLVAFDVARINDLLIRQDLSNPANAILYISAEIEHFIDGNLDIDMQVIFEGKVIAQIQEKGISEEYNKRVAIGRPALWWPNGLGNQPLYTVITQIKTDIGKVCHTLKTRIGLRTIEIVREKDSAGESFGFKINGALVFAKGGNWVPADALPNRLSEGDYVRLLEACKAVNMNMIRIWGGGLYEPDIFYDYCDENGIMLWHDFMFAVGPVSSNNEYVENVRSEIQNVVRRLRHHPSIILWCGNNEMESGMPNWIKKWDKVSWSDYDKIFNEVIPQTALLHDPDRPYWPSSPHHPLGRDKDTDGYEAESGDAHIWDIWHGGQPFSWYIQNINMRFVSEFGFQSLPHIETIRSFTLPEDRFFPSAILDHHNKAGHKPNQNIGNQRIARYMSSMYKMPTSLENWIYQSQIMHGEAMKIATGGYRRNFPYTTGALYWQINDNWPTISGSGIDYFGRWKALHYMAQHFFNPLLITGWVEGTDVKIWGVNDLLRDTTASMQWTLSRFDGTDIKHGEKEVEIPANSSTMIAELDFKDEVAENPEYITYRKDCYENRSNYYLSIKLIQNHLALSSDVLFFVLPKYLQLEDPNLTYRIEIEDGHLFIYITCDRFAAYVEAGLKNAYARFSDNYFHLLPRETKQIRVYEKDISEEVFKSKFYVKSLFDSFQ